MNQHLLWDLGERAVGHFNSTFGSSRIASRAYPSWPTNPEIRREMMEKSGRSTFPQIFIGEKHVGGCDDIFALDSAGKLDELLAS